MMKSFSLEYQKIDIYLNFCILYYLENVDLTECRTCGHTWYKPKTGTGKSLVAHKKMRYFPITLKLQMLFMSPKTIEHITWHHSYKAVDGVMMHHFNGET